MRSCGVPHLDLAFSRRAFRIENSNGPPVESVSALVRATDADEAELTEFGEASNQMKSDPFLAGAMEVEPVTGEAVVYRIEFQRVAARLPR